MSNKNRIEFASADVSSTSTDEQQEPQEEIILDISVDSVVAMMKLHRELNHQPFIRFHKINGRYHATYFYDADITDAGVPLTQ